MAETHTPVLATPAWVLVGMTRNVPGVLVHDGTRLAFLTSDGAVFDAPLEQVSDVRFPWYYFGGGCKLRVDGENVRVSFVQPNDAPPVTDELLGEAEGVFAAMDTFADVRGAMGSFRDVRRGREAGAAWKSRLT